jgi:hypothetical protein
MFQVRTPRLGAAFTLVAALAFATGCGDEDGTGPDGDPIVASWQVSSFSDGTTDFIAAGMTLNITLSSNDTYTFMATNDQVGVCSDLGTTTCTTTGTYSHTSSQIIIDPDDPEGAATFNYSISGNTMTWTGSIDDTAVTVVMTKTT